MGMRIAAPGAPAAGAHAERPTGASGAMRLDRQRAAPSTPADDAGGAEERVGLTGSGYWLEHSEGFQVVGPSGRVGFVELVLVSEGGVDGLVVRTGLLRTRRVFVPVHDVGAVVPRRRRLELLLAPRVSRASVSGAVRELVAPAAEAFSAAAARRGAGDVPSVHWISDERC